jgi:hypothetical protein
VLVANEGGGSADQIDAVEKTLAELLPRAEVVRASDDLEDAMRSAAERATPRRGRARSRSPSPPVGRAPPGAGTSRETQACPGADAR